MAFFDDLKETAKAAAEQTKIIAKTVGKKAEAMMEIQKRSGSIDKQKKIINDSYKQIGEYMYERFKQENYAPDDIKGCYEAIVASNAEIERLYKEIALIKQELSEEPAPASTCPGCGAAVTEAAKFCPQCGMSLTKEETPAEESAAQEAEPAAEAGEVTAEASEPAAEAAESAETEAANEPQEAKSAAEAEQADEKAE